jgi:hypothetical protein
MPFAAPGGRSVGVRLAGFLLLLAGWGLVLAALAMLVGATPRTIFVLAGFAVEILGLTLAALSHRMPAGEQP